MKKPVAPFVILCFCLFAAPLPAEDTDRNTTTTTTTAADSEEGTTTKPETEAPATTETAAGTEASAASAPLAAEAATSSASGSGDSGAQKGTEQVGSSGAFTYTYPINLPPGTNGMAPALSLSYNSMAGNGMLGMGFSLTGLPVISRDPSYPIRFDGGDHFLYEGQKLFAGSDGYYHTERESYVRIQAFDMDSASSYWVVIMKNGTKLYFGATADSHADAVGQGGKARLWALNKVEDVHGNYYDVEYVEDTANGDYYPLRITYTKGNGLTKFRTVEFSYETRSDHGPMYVPTKVDTDLRMKWIMVKADGTLIRKYRLDYENGGGTGRCRIVGIQEYGSDGNFPAPGLIGSYTPMGSAFPELVLGWNSSSQGSNAWFDSDVPFYSSISDTVFRDFNGDGRTDMGFRHADGHLWISCSTESGMIGWFDSGVPLYSSLSETVFCDFNGDGKTDMGFRHENGNLWIAYSTGTGMNGWFDSGVQVYVEGAYRGLKYTVFRDFNGDGKTDMGFRNATGGNLWIAYSTGTGMNGWSDSGVLLYYGLSDTVFQDFNGDGKTDMGFRHENGRLYIAYSTGTGMNGWFDSGVPLCSTLSDTVFQDFNGDGKIDMGFRHDTNGHLWIAYSTGTGMNGWFDSGVPFCSTLSDTVFQDFNGDGRTDMGFRHDNGHLWIAYSTESGMNGWFDSGVPFCSTLSTTVFQDFNGDGRTDMGFRHDNGHLWINTFSLFSNELLLNLSIPTGGTISVTYTPAPQVPGAVVPASSSYPLLANSSPRSLVTKLEYNDGFGNTSEKRYEYSNGLYHSGLPHERADLGFQVFREKVKQTDGTFITTETEFQYGSTAAEKKLFAGLPKRQTVYGSDGNKYAETRNYYTAEATAVAGVSFVHPTETRTLNYNGDNAEASAVKGRTTYAYGTYGDPTSTINYGEVDSNWNDILQDRTETTTEYAININPAKWIFAPSRQTVKAYDLAGTYDIAAEKRFFYYSGESDNVFGESIAAAGNPGAKGLLARIEYENGAGDVSQSFAYNDNGTLWKAKDAKGVVTKTVTYDLDYATIPRTETNALGQMTETIYDALMRPIEVVDAAGVSAYLRYDVFGRVAKAWGYGDSESSPTKRYAYFDAAALPASPAYAQEELKDNSSDGYLTSRTYLDGFGRKLQAKTELEASGQYSAADIHYDAAGRAYKTSIPYVSTSLSFNASSERTSASRTFAIRYFDSIGRAYRNALPDGTNTYAIYGKKYQASVDAEGRVRAAEVDGSQKYAYTYQTLDYTGYSYDQMKSNFAANKDSWYHRIRTQKGRNGSIIAERSGTNGTENVITVATDMLGRKTSYADPDKGTWTYQYDENGNLTYQQDAKGNIVRFEYDGLNRPSVKKHDTTTVSSYTYKITGQLDTVTYAGGSDSFTYNPRGQVSNINRAVTGYGTKSIAMTYDSMGRVATQTYPDGEVVTNTYNASGNLETMAGASSYVTNVDYNEYGKITNFAFGNGKTTIYAYNNLNGRMTDLDVAGVLDNHYTYDLVGNITRRDDYINTAYTETYGYDELYRLTSAQGYYGTKAYTYDAYGNITSKDGKYYYYPSVGGVQPHAVTSDGTNTYSYDVNGNMTTGKGRTLTYDTENRVTQITKDGVTTTMGYDDSGERITKTVGNVVSVYWFGSYEERYTSGSLSEATKYYSANGQPVAQRSSVSGLLYIHRDHLGSVSKITNSLGTVVQTMEYIPYGTKTYASGGEYTDYGYTGQENDPSTGLYYFHARYYDPELGRFMQADTVLDGVNRYTYCGNNPVMFVDPSGMWTLGLGFVFGWDEGSGWHFGFGAAFDFSKETGIGANASYVFNQNGSQTATLGISATIGVVYAGVSYSYNTVSGNTISAYAGAWYIAGGAEIGISIYGTTGGEWFGGTGYIKGYLGLAWVNAGGGYEFGFGALEGSGWFAEAELLGGHVRYGQNTGLTYGFSQSLFFRVYDSSNQTTRNGSSGDGLSRLSSEGYTLAGALLAIPDPLTTILGSALIGGLLLNQYKEEILDLVQLLSEKFKGGKQGARDPALGGLPNEFVKWFHAEKQKQPGGPPNWTYAEIMAEFEFWRRYIKK